VNTAYRDSYRVDNITQLQNHQNTTPQTVNIHVISWELV
jgi:hypothetical protein